MFNRFAGFATVLLAVLVFRVSVQAAPLVIDDFEDGSIDMSSSYEDESYYVVEDGLDPAHVLTGSRTVSLVWKDDDLATLVSQPDAPDVNDDGVVFHAEGNNNRWFNLRYQPDGGISFVAGGNDRFRVIFAEAPAAGMFRVQVKNLNFISDFIDVFMPVNGAGVYEITFDDFKESNFIPDYFFETPDVVDLTVMDLGEEVGPVTYELIDFRVVPEPAACSVLLLSCLMLRRKK